MRAILSSSLFDLNFVSEDAVVAIVGWLILGILSMRALLDVIGACQGIEFFNFERQETSIGLSRPCASYQLPGLGLRVL